MMPRTIVVLVAVLGAAAAAAEAPEVLVPAEVISVYDGDTFTAIARPWPQISIETSVRVAGVDTPELRAACDAEQRAAIAARERVRALLGRRVLLVDPDYGKYAGRVVARVRLSDGRDLTDVLLAEGLGRPYDGRSRESWCEPGDAP